MKFKKILTIGISTASLDEKYWKELKGLADKVISLSKDSSDIEKELSDTDCILTGFGIEINKRHIDLAKNLKYIGTLATAYGKIDVDYAKKKNIPVCNLGGYSTEGVAEFTIAAILEHIRALGEGKSRAHAGNYSEVGIKATEIKGKKFGVIGLGNIGGRVAEIAQGFGANVSYWSRSKKSVFEKQGIKYQELDTLLKEADFVSINLAETKDTENFFDAKKFKLLKSGAVVINTAPMEIVNLKALTERLAKNDMTFILDHSDQMKDEDVKSLIKFKNCIVYPPIAYITDEARANKQQTFISNIENFFKGTSTNRVN
ncbi:MAG TPA: 2-hydroxyacid dehydrogenase [Candidatus Paceibacterota bacterium]|nr:2-hydroxyacid dehydrogenase [Candidatus Paceibacterota bacterium]